jgi:cytochrome bd-type quinol oxidase subunit 2
MQIETFWFIALVFTLTMYVVLDGFDLGVGILHLTVAKTDDERRTLFNAIGPLWDGNEVWLIAAKVIELRHDLERLSRSLGYRWITLDLGGYRTGGST